MSCVQLCTGVPTKAQEEGGEGRQVSLYCRLASYLPHACTRAGTLLPVVIGQSCKLVFSIRKLRKQKNAVCVSGLSLGAAKEWKSHKQPADLHL